MEAVYKLKFEEEPNYKKLRFLLLKVLLDRNEVPTKEFDWLYYPDENTDVLSGADSQMSSISLDDDPDDEYEEEERLNL